MLSFKTIPIAKVFNTPRPQNPSPADEVASNDDLLIEILIHLPVKSLLQFKSVSKRWLSLITSPHLSNRRYPYPCTPSGLFLRPLCGNPFNHHILEEEFIPIDNRGNLTSAPFGACSYFPDLSSVRILDSCNGLLCCSSSSRVECEENYHVYNPTTKQFITLPEPGQGVQRNIDCLSLAFDPSKSTDLVYRECFQIEIYSSETRRWRKSVELFNAGYAQFDNGVYWNGAINWISSWGYWWYFNIDHDRLGTMPMQPHCDERFKRPFRYFGKSHDHLHLVEIYFMTQFDVYEMKRDYSEWFVKYRVDLEGVVSAFPEMILNHFDPLDLESYAFSILSLVRGERDEESFLVLHTPGKVLRYNIADKTFKKLCDVGPHCCFAENLEVKSSLRYAWFDAFQYIESLLCV
ncbi:F-box protein At5g07610-like [Cornus florida]|uniref:F-box protein At5g07610-like n=1 Tax=Cornus florida TaxID=4283 RepID=UPI0028A19BEC|nr:F-box protein At5g07610-like [Cornus florida]